MISVARIDREAVRRQDTPKIHSGSRSAEGWNGVESREAIQQGACQGWDSRRLATMLAVSGEIAEMKNEEYIVFEF